MEAAVAHVDHAAATTGFVFTPPLTGTAQASVPSLARTAYGMAAPSAGHARSAYSWLL